jgi:uncharacterized protein YbjT (DUF2867 family)
LRDVARWFATALERWDEVQGKTLIAQGPEQLTFAKAGRRFANNTGRRALSVPRQAFALGGWASPRMRTLHELFRYYDREDEPMLSQETWRLLGEPQVSFDHFLAGLETWFDAHEK